MTELIPSQVRDALAFMEALGKALDALPDEPKWGGGLHLILPGVIPLASDDGTTDQPLAWLVANDFNGYDLTTKEPS